MPARWPSCTSAPSLRWEPYLEALSRRTKRLDLRLEHPPWRCVEKGLRGAGVDAGREEGTLQWSRWVVLGAAGRAWKREWVAELRHPLVAELTGAIGRLGMGTWKRGVSFLVLTGRGKSPLTRMRTTTGATYYGRNQFGFDYGKDSEVQ